MDKKLYWSAITFALSGLAISIYMAIYKITENNAMCLGSGGCASINASRYSELYGIPLGVIGAVGYAGILLMLWLEKRHPLAKEYGNMAAMGMSFAGFIFSIYLMYLSFYVIKATCPFCVASAISITLCFILTFIRFVRAEN
ncbi:MAG: vitamin K epoxide reductase family protein [Anaerolineales bacterium]|nr:vitamin K epoxide reductase family protein [Anaerolineales bacterium]